MLGPAVAVLAVWALFRASASAQAPSVLPEPRQLPRGGMGPANPSGIFSEDEFHSPSGRRVPTAGVQSHPDHHWSYVVRETSESAGSIAEKILGADQAWRYVELLVANPWKRVHGVRVVPEGAEDELNFETLSVGETLRLPRSWNGWIDEVGNPRGQALPWPAPKEGV